MQGLTLAEARSHYTLWAILKSPLLLGADASLMSEEILQILKNQDLRKIQEVRNAIIVPFTYKNDHCAKTGSGQT